MVQSLKKKMKEQKGFTLIELLAVIVILGIIAAIAIPSIIGIINNSKKDAHVANAQQMVSSARTGVANGQYDTPTTDATGTGTTKILLSKLISDGLMESPKDPTDSNGTYNTTDSFVVVSLHPGDANKLDYTVTLKGTGGTVHIGAKESADLKRSVVTP